MGIVIDFPSRDAACSPRRNVSAEHSGQVVILPVIRIERYDDKPAELFTPGDAWRFRWNRWSDTPLPPDEPAGENPPEGALLYYWLKDAAAGPVVLEILDDAGRLVRRFSSDDVPEPMLEGQQVPPRWVRPPEVVSAEPGMHRFAWDLRYERPPIPAAPKP